jgi:hypothetical protein
MFSGRALLAMLDKPELARFFEISEPRRARQQHAYFLPFAILCATLRLNSSSGNGSFGATVAALGGGGFLHFEE